MTAEDEVRAASTEFYAALNRMLAGDASSLGAIWSHSSTVTALHPIGDWHVGWEDVRTSFEKVAKASTGGQVAMTDQLIRVGEDMAYEVGVEHAQFSIAGEPLTVNSRVTNIYRREAGAWKIVHHHGDKSAGISEPLDRARSRGPVRTKVRRTETGLPKPDARGAPAGNDRLGAERGRLILDSLQRRTGAQDPYC